MILLKTTTTLHTAGAREISIDQSDSAGGKNFTVLTSMSVKDVRANCFCASLLRTQIRMPRHT